MTAADASAPAGATRSGASPAAATQAEPGTDPFVSFTSSDRFATVGEIYEAARRALPPPVWDFLDGGSGGEQTLRANLSSFERWSVLPRLMTGAGEPDLARSFLGIELSMPVMTSPFGADRLLHRDGHLAVARANAKAGVASIVPEAGSYSWEEVTMAAPGAARIAQLHPMGNPANFAAMLRRAADLGFSALCLTLDCPTAGWRERNMRNRFDVDVDVVSGNYPHAGPADLADTLGQLFVRREPIWTWDELAGRMAGSPLPWLAKGILTGADAVAAARAGAAGILVSNHGGRQLDAVPAALDQLPEIVAALGGRVPVALDSGVRRGGDVVKALALGADVVVIGRAAAMALAAGGEEGVGRLLELFREEISTTVKLLGATGVDGLTSEMITSAAGRAVPGW
ncbi:alpha-hydroxy acid oxidase [Pseudofrankia sp. BMG5.37]|uniref:alpha-hydroxy acid oxidase n=1 Tax=Pseudofrankia sp. BMG5.37 TaxID=3050035 RepID=UPI00289578BA|nr:alpha-hydroxy acid oxidase [Pseudofrankia sp. BMG5.37]MDT3444642.1 alpha-hydroxy acid oxidase [Pseudofrankia sp. BMG5.37]